MIKDNFIVIVNDERSCEIVAYKHTSNNITLFKAVVIVRDSSTTSSVSHIADSWTSEELRLTLSCGAAFVAAADHRPR